MVISQSGEHFRTCSRLEFMKLFTIDNSIIRSLLLRKPLVKQSHLQKYLLQTTKRPPPSWPKRIFGNKQMIINNRRKNLLNPTAVTSKRFERALWFRGSSCARCYTWCTFEFYSSLISSVLIDKVTHDARSIVSREFKGEDWELDMLLIVMQQELEARVRANRKITVQNSSYLGGTFNLHWRW